MDDHVRHEVKHERMQRMLAVARMSRQAYLDRFVGREAAVLWERSRVDVDGGAVWDGLTDNYVRVNARCDRDLRNAITMARLVAHDGEAFTGEML
jgi:tRNA A37 methylthiotransferase MiaB